MTKPIRLSVSWGNDVGVDLTISAGQWKQISDGHSVTINGKGYFYEGERFQDVWNFAGGLDGELRVSYGDADGFVGTARDAMPTKKLRELPLTGVLLLERHGSNMVGDEWTWSFFVSRTSDGRFTVSAKQSVRAGQAMRVSSRRRLKGAVEIYEALESMMSELGYSLDDEQICAASVALRRVDARLAQAFLSAPLEAERLSEQSWERAEGQRLLKPVKATIERYVEQFDDRRKLGYWGSKRYWMRRFIEQYFLENGALPVGKHLIHVRGPMGFTGGEHDFTGLNHPGFVGDTNS
jgi:hypothetical protein